MTLFEAIDFGVNSSSIEETCLHIQNALGQTDEDMADIVFSDIEGDDWKNMKKEEKYNRIIRYINIEMFEEDDYEHFKESIGK